MTLSARQQDDQDEQSTTTSWSVLIPPFDSPERTSTYIVATFNLVATIVGGGVLSLPLAFEKCGILLATLFMLLAAIVTDLCLYLLCKCARQTHANAYGEVGRMAFGQKMEWFISMLLFVFLLFVLVAYMVLVRDIWTPIVGMIMPVTPRGDVVLLSIVCLMSPFLVQRTLHSLRYNCYVGFASISILCMALCHRAWWQTTTTQKRYNDDSQDDDSTDILFGITSNFGDALFAFPIITLSFLCSFNILSIQSALIHPTKARIAWVIHGAVGTCFLIMYLFGLGGYLYFGSLTEGNILLNMSTRRQVASDNHNEIDLVLFVGRIGCGITIMLALAMMTLPCRDSILEILDCWMEARSNHRRKQQQFGCKLEESNHVELLVVVEEESSTNGMMHPNHQHHHHVPTNKEKIHSNETTPLLSSCKMIPMVTPALSHEQQEEQQIHDRVHLSEYPVAHYGMTLFIVLVTYLGAVAAPGVAIVWSLCGSSMAFVIAFILPTACYLKIQQHHQDEYEKYRSLWIVFSWCVLVASIVGAMACTVQTTWSLVDASW